MFQYSFRRMNYNSYDIFRPHFPNSLVHTCRVLLMNEYFEGSEYLCFYVVVGLRQEEYFVAQEKLGWVYVLDAGNGIHSEGSNNTITLDISIPVEECLRSSRIKSLM